MPTSSVWQGISRASDRPVNVREQVIELFGTTGRGGPDTRAAAAALGVSTRTVQRWIAQNRPAATPAGQRLGQQHQAFRNTPAGRATQVAPGRDRHLRRRGTQLIIKARFNISSDSSPRVIRVVLTGTQMGPILDAGLAGGDAAAQAALEAFLSTDYFAGSVTMSDIQDISTNG